MSESLAGEEVSPRPEAGWVSPQLKELVATVAAIGGLVGLMLTLCGAAIGPVQDRMGRIEARQTQGDHDSTEVIQRLTRVEERTGDNTRILRRLESWMERH